ncbi:hypothetical protein RIF29_45419 [Crotalaria pallida]|uniref:Uncharacterized protein n=1 Tax=Crotalaria pallida TaxID=3830 RepID=A0AAN9DVU5_CROPI
MGSGYHSIFSLSCWLPEGLPRQDRWTFLILLELVRFLLDARQWDPPTNKSIGIGSVSMESHHPLGEFYY